MLARLDDLRAQRSRLRAHLAGAGDLRAAQLWDGMAATRTAEAELWREIVNGKVEMEVDLDSSTGRGHYRLIIRAAYGAMDASNAIAFENRETAERLRAGARQVQAEGEAALADTGFVFVPGVGVVREHRTEADR